MTYDLLMLMFDDPHAEEVERYLTSKQIKVVREHTVKKAIQALGTIHTISSCWTSDWKVPTS